MRLLFCSMVVISLAGSLLAQGKAKGGAAPPAMTMSIPGFPDGGHIPVKFSQAAPGVAVGEGTSPAMSWANVPAGTQSFMLHMHDMDLARNKTTDDQVHWVVWNIPAGATGFPEGVPKGSQMADGSYQISATGPMYRGPGAGANGPFHHYVWEFYALDTKLDLPANTTRDEIMKGMEGHVIGKAAYVGRFHNVQ